MRRIKIEYSEPVILLFNSKFKSQYGVESLLSVAQHPLKKKTNCPVD